MKSVVCVNIVCTQGDIPEQRRMLAERLANWLSRVNDSDNLMIGLGYEDELANTAISISVEEKKWPE